MIAVISYLVLAGFLAITLYTIGMMAYLSVYEKQKPIKPLHPTLPNRKLPKAA